jgi:HlyD family secretion protein
MSPRFKAFMKRRQTILLGAGILLLAGGGWGAVRYARPTRPDVPLADVKRGEFVDTVELRGELKALRSVTITAPSNAGDILIVKLLKSGTPVKKGDVVAVLDTSVLQNTLDQRKSDLKQADAQIENSQAQARLTQETDQTEIGRAHV